jgi:hypothetical protein
MSSSAALRQLAADLEREIAALDRITVEATEALALLRERMPSPLELRGAGDVVHDFYNVIERFFERVAVEMNGGLPVGADSHRRLLERLAHEVPEVRPAVVRAERVEALSEVLRFRHLFRHRYGFELDWARLEPLLERLAPLGADVRADLQDFVGYVLRLATRLER